MAPKAAAADIDAKYKKLEQRDHVYQLPDTYIGSVESAQIETYVFDDASGAMQKREITYVPGLYKIYDEVLVNAIDQVARLKAAAAAGAKDVKHVKTIKITVDQATGQITVFNDGDGIDVEKHASYGDVWVPELIFGHLLTSTNYDPSEEKLWGGKNGFGAKLANIFSTEFKLETVDHRRERIYKQTWKDNMKTKSTPTVKAYTKTPYTEISFKPEYARFGLTGITPDIYQLFRKRAFDACATTDASVSIYFNGEKLVAKDFEKYGDLYIGAKDVRPRAYESCNDRWEVIATYSDNGQFEQVSFVNGINTLRGGKHVEYITNQITKRLSEMAAKKKKDVKQQHIKDNLFVLIKSSIVNPAFDSQTKETLTTQASKFGSKCDLSDKFFDKLYKTGILEKAISLTEFHDAKKLAKTDGKKTTRVLVPKLDDANWAGTKRSSECTLLLTEGDSARSMAIAGLSVVGRDTYGVFPLRGKILNVKDAQLKRIQENEEITNLKKILGLQHGKEYKDASELRYGHIMVMCDADTDGSHIKGLLFNVFQSIWPSLFKQDGFLTSMLTPIIKATHNKGTTMKFYSMSDFENWRQVLIQAPGGMSGWKIKYYKGLGTSTESEAKEYFKEMKQVTYIYDGKKSDEALDLAFNKKRADDRKDWLMKYRRNNILDYNEARVPYDDFVHKELIHFSNRDLERSINHLCDGLKESTRKILFGCFKRKLFKDEIKVAQLAAYIAEVSAYHHGEASLQQAITGMAQVFIGANNINLLSPNGQFGCLDPNTNVLMWDGRVLQARDIKVGDKLVGDDGLPRTVLHTTNGHDNMFKIAMRNGESYVVNSQHILTLQCTMNGKIYWKESAKAWHAFVLDPKTMQVRTFHVCTKDSSPGSHYNASKLTKTEAYDLLNQKLADYQAVPVIDVKLDQFMALPKYIKSKCYCIKNTSCIQWEYKPVPIDPYIFGCWIGDGSASGTGITSMDVEILQAFATYFDTISCELTHDPNYVRDGIVHENYHFTVRKRGSENTAKTSIGDADHCPEVCIGCQTSSKKHAICSWKFEKTPPNQVHFEGVADNGMRRSDMNPWKSLLKKYDLMNNKHVPVEYIYNDKKTRLQFLAGMIDTDGTVKYQSGIPVVEIVQSARLHAHIIKSVQIIANSLGYQTTMTTNDSGKVTKKGETINLTSLRIMGHNLDEIPTRVARKQIKYERPKIKSASIQCFTIEALGQGEFCGWQVDGNERFLLADYTITHNSRVQGGQDAASPRYIFTVLSKLARTIFREEDQDVLKYLDDDGMLVEPEYYIPIVPMILINGGLGIGTGFSTNVPCHNPSDIIDQCERIAIAIEKEVGAIEHTDQLDGANKVIDKIKLSEIKPWYLGFTGQIIYYKDGSYASKGVYSWVDDQTVEITELPIGTWTDDYKDMLATMIANGSTYLKDFNSHYTAKNVRFVLKLHQGVRAKLDKTFETEFKLISTKNLSLNNIHLYSANGAVQRYKDTTEVLKAWAQVRIRKYLERKQYQLKTMENDFKIVSAKVRFIQDIIDEKLIINNKKLQEVEEQLKAHRFPLNSQSDDEAQGGYNYLTRMPIYSVTHERKKELEKDASELKMTIDNLRAKPITTIWREELLQFKTAWDHHKEIVEAEYEADRLNKPIVSKKRNGTRK